MTKKAKTPEINAQEQLRRAQQKDEALFNIQSLVWILKEDCEKGTYDESRITGLVAGIDAIANEALMY